MIAKINSCGICTGIRALLGRCEFGLSLFSFKQLSIGNQVLFWNCYIHGNTLLISSFSQMERRKGLLNKWKSQLCFVLVSEFQSGLNEGKICDSFIAFSEASLDFLRQCNKIRNAMRPSSGKNLDGDLRNYTDLPSSSTIWLIHFSENIFKWDVIESQDSKKKSARFVAMIVLHELSFSNFNPRQIHSHMEHKQSLPAK